MARVVSWLLDHALPCASAELLPACVSNGYVRDEVAVARHGSTEHLTLVRNASQPVCGLQMCVEMVIAVALRNRDRLLLIWPHVHDFLAAILAPAQVLCMGCRRLSRHSSAQEAFSLAPLAYTANGMANQGVV